MERVVDKRIKEGKLQRVWDHADSPLLWVETIWSGDVEKMPTLLGFQYNGHYFKSIDQTTTFYRDTESESKAKEYGEQKYKNRDFVEKYCVGSEEAEKSLQNITVEIQKTDFKTRKKEGLKDQFRRFFDAYATIMGFYRFSRPEFYENIISQSPKMQQTLKPVGDRRYSMHHAWMEAFTITERLFAAIGKNCRCSSLIVKNCTRLEILKMLDDATFPSDIQDRIKSFEFIYHDDVSYSIGTGLVAKKEDLRHIASIKGQSAFPGLVQGKVFLIIESLKGVSTSADSMNAGDILVTNMTSPDMLPLMQKAAAFVTDEGGLLCHAAIVARELKKPCVIGTKIATKILKDGDMVELDAENGIVRILEKAK